jgi:endonuclease-3
MPSSKHKLQTTTAVLESDRNRANFVLEILRQKLTIRDEDFASVVVAKRTHDPFRVLIVTILTQNCTDIAAMRAYAKLDETIGVTMEALREATTGQIRRAIREAGLHRQKAKAIRELARQIADRHHDLRGILDAPVEEARAELQELPKVGPKTSDVLLGIWNRPTISVDTHVERVSKRLGFARAKARYEEVRASLMQLFREADYPLIPLILMAHGRTFCKARKPLCPLCPVEKLCLYQHKTPG